MLLRSPLSGKTLAKLGNNCASNLFYYRFFCDYLFFKSIENEPMFELLQGGILYFFRFSRAEGIKAVTLISQRDTKLANKKKTYID
jgi:hypothetical protein